MSLSVVGIVTARGGSKGIPRKNIKLLAGKPLLAHTAEAALGAQRLKAVVLTTDDPEIAEVGRQAGLETPFLRPAELARDDTPTLPVLEHAVAWLEAQDRRFDAICLLQPTNPLRRAQDIDAAIDLLETSQADSVISVLPVPAEHNPHWVYFRDNLGRLRLSTGEPAPIPRRQALPPAYHREGSIYVMRRDVLMNQHSLFGASVVGLPMDPAQSVNIDDPDDWERAEALIRQRGRS